MTKKFGDLPDNFSNLKDAKIVILPVAFDQTTSYMHGTNKGPAAIIEASSNMELYDIETELEVHKRGIFTAPFIESTNSKKMLKEVYEKTKHFLDQDKFVVTLGGEHSISSSPIRAHAEHFSSVSVLQLDAHTDLMDALDENPLSHGSVMARVKEIKEVKNIVAVGIRSMAIEEIPTLDKDSTFFAHDIFQEGDTWMEKVLEKLSDQVYITFDLDVFDSSLMPSTGTPEPGGLFWYQTLKLLKKVAARKKIVGFDVVELCPVEKNPAPDFLAAKLVYKLLSYIWELKKNENTRIFKEAFQTF